MKVCEDNDYCYIEITKKGELLKYQPGVKSSTTNVNMKCVDIHCLQIVHLTKKNVIDNYRGKDCLKKYFEDLRKHAKSIIVFEKKEMIELTDEEKFKHRFEDKCFI